MKWGPKTDLGLYGSSYVGLLGAIVAPTSDPRILQWITESGMAALISDNYAVEEYPAPAPPGDVSYPVLPLHHHCLFKLGVHLGELWYLAELAAWLRAHHRNRFLLTAPPLRLPGAVGSPATPIATV
jgi:kynurenine formamidase